jgi:anthranilate synthase component 1
MIADTLAIFDHVRRRTILLANAHVGDEGPKVAYLAALRKIDLMAERLRRPWTPQHADPLAEPRPAAAPGVFGKAVPAKPGKPAPNGMTSNFSKEEFEERVERVKEYIRAGDAFQVVLSQRFCRPYAGDPFDVYRALRSINPSPYMFYLKLGEVQLAGSSPEILVRVQDGQVTLRPIAGTRWRGATKAEDLALEQELLADPKELAEHIMLVDLGRNDVGRVATPGSVAVDRLMFIERYSHVMHIVSNVIGRLAPGKDCFDALAAAFPAGTLSGAPKIRAMEIIDEMETLRRGPYGGAVGYFSFDGNLDSCIILRTCLIMNGRVHVQAGGGLVADSVPANEYQESVNKAMAVAKAVQMAEAGLD